MNLPVIVLCRDLIFSSKIRAAAKAAGLAPQFLRDPAKLAEVDGPGLLADLNLEGALDAAVAWKTRTGGQVTGFVAHVAVDTIAQAKQAGVDRILSNGALSQQVEAVLQALAAE